ncbi:hypothetical protein [Antrihabitans spumae]|uniref:Uncharacterized protein n=1 Tax=Antrihabitans spumae TaxID=3373370 RepID=A0ABW7KGS5_9NOCA
MSSSNEFHKIVDAVRRDVDRIAIIAAIATLSAPCFRGAAEERAAREYVRIVREKTPLRLLHLNVPGRTVPSVAAQLADLDPTVSAVLVTGSIVPEDTTALRSEVAALNGPTVLFELDLLTATLTAAAIGVLRSRDVPPRSGKIVIAGAERAPLLTQTLTASRCGSVVHWGIDDRSVESLQNLMRTNDVLIALDDRVPRDLAPAQTVRPPIDPTAQCSLVLPGLLSALCGFGGASVTPQLLMASGVALTVLSGHDEILPDSDDPLLVAAVARFATRALFE